MKALLLSLVLAFTTASRSSAQSWDPAPLRTPTPIPRDGLPQDRGAFFRWLRDRAGQLSDEQRQRARERVYVYISELAKRLGGTFPSANDSAATELLRIAAGFDIPGSPAGIVTSFHAPLFSVASDDSSWAVCFPYYFMPTPLGRQVPANGVSTELAMLSTLFAPDSGESGSSQATIMIAAAPVADSLKHLDLWLRQLGLTPDAGGISDAPGHWTSAPGASMRREAVVRRLPQRVVLAAYMGLPGTFEANRPHFLNVVRTLSARRCAA